MRFEDEIMELPKNQRGVQGTKKAEMCVARGTPATNSCSLYGPVFWERSGKGGFRKWGGTVGGRGGVAMRSNGD